jgi:oligopeptide/dipeptide ABC transporter ATP-binding protein
MAIILITHDLGVIAELAERVLVMYAGRVVEKAEVEELFERPLHPYTRGLMGSMPHLTRESPDASARLTEIPGIVPSLDDLPPGCSFAPRCAHARPHCSDDFPPLEPHGGEHRVACFESGRLPAWQPRLEEQRS